jgi:hypothetical protein
MFFHRWLWAPDCRAWGGGDNQRRLWRARLVNLQAILDLIMYAAERQVCIFRISTICRGETGWILGSEQTLAAMHGRRFGAGRAHAARC